jgi:LPXTG-site transpeptidase (sortase) family protein
MTFTGSLTNINAALNGLTYTNVAVGADTLTIVTNDQGNTGVGGSQTDTDTVGITVNEAPPRVVTNGVNSNTDTGDGILAESEVATVNITQLLVTFSEAMDNVTTGDQVTNPDNYLLLAEGSVAGFQTASCAVVKTGAGVDPGDTQITITSVTYDNGTFTATLNLASALPNGFYRLYACGTTTLRDLIGNPLAGNGAAAGTDFIRNFQVQLTGGGGAGTGATTLPATGFPIGKVTKLPVQPASKAYASTDLILEIPALGQKMTIVGVPQSDDSWDVTWLGNSAGYLAGSAFPTWSGNTVITGHVWDAWNQPGPFAQLKMLKHGDQIKIHAFGQVYTYEVRESKLVTSRNVKAVLQHEEYDWVTLLSCEYYNPFTGSYLFRRMVRAVLVSVK